MKKLIVPAMLVILMTACNKSDQITLDARIKSFSKSACSSGTVTQFDFNGAKVYVFDDGCGAVDGGAEVTDANGNDICYLGGFTGNLECQGTRFDSAAKNPVIVYQKR